MHGEYCNKCVLIILINLIILTFLLYSSFRIISKKSPRSIMLRGITIFFYLTTFLKKCKNVALYLLNNNLHLFLWHLPLTLIRVSLEKNLQLLFETILHHDAFKLNIFLKIWYGSQIVWPFFLNFLRTSK